ncbi:hypothetical protein BDP27DRAFT_1414623 [Rhodocollybia butyracea]|uniref:Uncharacterized protein n=1 Tax=Rhodocollybia butyracea TaxID=206335 RepID=A0A9P5Q7I0_9AGAR|nr:hypothetical protein BDP27DRAFT_1414623 [Rhodocollybia butyracea]
MFPLSILHLRTIPLQIGGEATATPSPASLASLQTGNGASTAPPSSSPPRETSPDITGSHPSSPCIQVSLYNKLGPFVQKHLDGIDDDARKTELRCFGHMSTYEQMREDNILWNKDVLDQLFRGVSLFPPPTLPLSSKPKPVRNVKSIKTPPEPSACELCSRGRVKMDMSPVPSILGTGAQVLVA